MHIVWVSWIVHTPHSKEGEWEEAVEVNPKPELKVPLRNFAPFRDQLTLFKHRHVELNNYVTQKHEISDKIQINVRPVLNFWEESQSKGEYEGRDDLESQFYDRVCEVHWAY